MNIMDTIDIVRTALTRNLDDAWKMYWKAQEYGFITMDDQKMVEKASEELCKFESMVSDFSYKLIRKFIDKSDGEEAPF